MISLYLVCYPMIITNSKTLSILLVVLLTSISTHAFFKGYDSLITEFKNHSNDTHGVHILNEIAFQGYTIAPEELKTFSIKALDLSNNLGFHQGIVKSKLNLGLYYFIINDFSRALEHYESVLQLANVLEDQLLVSQVHVHIGIVHENNNRENDALKEFYKALEAAESINNDKQIAIVNGNLGNLYEERGDYKKAIKSYQIALNLYPNVDEAGFKSTIFGNLGLVYHSLGYYDKALDNFLKSIKLDSLNNNKYGLSNNFGNIGRTYRITSQFNKSFSSYNKAISIDSTTNNKLGLVYDYIGLCHLFLDLANDTIYPLLDSLTKDQFKGEKSELLYQSLWYGKKAEKLMEGKKNQNPGLYFALKEVYKGMGLDSLALYYTDKYWQTENELNSIEKTKEFANLESERLSLINENKIQKLKSNQEQQRIILIGALLFLALSIAFVIVTFLRLKTKRKANTQLLFLNKSLNESNNSREKFISVIAHDLINPISGLSSALKIYKREKNTLSKHEDQDYINGLINAAESANNLLINLLEWGRVQSGLIKFNPISTDVNGLILSNIELIKQSAKLKKITINYQQTEALIIECDQYMINSVLSNLITNAIKFSNENSTIIIASELFEKFLTISITDHGTGMSTKAISNLFKISEHNTLPGTKNEKGTGLGLILCKEFIDAHNGEILVESELNSGTTFTIKLPSKQK